MHNILKCFRIKLPILLVVSSFLGNAQETKSNISKNIMLILGSGNLKSSVERATIGFDLYTSHADFDYIIVSGGCGAHGSTICEATVMADVLIEKGIPESLIFKEEKSRNTAQNYCYTKELARPDGTKLINAGDRLYVVSNHWHAMSVSGCFNDRDLVNSSFVIAGNSIPKTDQKTDYNGIYQNCMERSYFCELVLWPKVDASYSMTARSKKESKSRSVLFLNDLVIDSTVPDSKFSTITNKIKSLPDFWTSEIQASFYNKFENLVYLFKDQQCVAINPETSKIEKGFPKSLNSMFPELPPNWIRGNFDATFFDSKRKLLYFFKEDAYLRVAIKRKHHFILESPKQIKDFVLNWPFTWGSGSVDAAQYNEVTDEVTFYRGQEKLILKFDNQNQLQSNEVPQKVELEWPATILGAIN